VWLASSRFRADRELACDAKALGHLAQHEAREYGHTILRLIESFAAGPCIPSMVGIGENLDHLKLRVAMIGRFARRPLHWALLAGMAALCLGIVTLTDARVPRAGQGGSISATSGAQLPDPLIGQTEALWKELRRPETAWQSFLAELQNIRSQQIKQRMPAWKSVHIPLPEFRLVDAQGKTWQLSDLKGKTSFIQVWAVWSSKHNDNLKPVQGLYDRLKDRRDVLFLTLNADEYTPQIEPFLKEKGYTFPVIPAYRYVESISRFTGSGQSWILDRTGTIRMQLTGYIAGADAVNEALAQIDRLAQGK
jgi:hypothetical protein